MIEIPWQTMLIGLIGGILRVIIGYSKSHGMFSYPLPFRTRRAFLTIAVALLSGAIAPVVMKVEDISAIFVAGFAGADLLEAAAKGLMKAKTGFSTGFTRSKYSEFGYQSAQESGLSKHHENALRHLERFGKITNHDYQKINRVSDSTATRDLKTLVRKGIAKKIGRGRYAYYKPA